MAESLTDQALAMLFEREENQRSEMLRDLVLTQRDHSEGNWPLFTHKGRVYTAQASLVTDYRRAVSRRLPRPVPQVNRKLPKYLEKIRELDRVRVPIKAVLEQLEQRFPCNKALKTMLPAALHRKIDLTYPGELGNISEESVRSFQARNANSLSLIHQKLARDLIME